MPRVQPKLGLTGFEFEMTDGATSLEYWAEEVKETQELHDGSGKFYHKGYKFHARLTFASAPRAQADGLRGEYNRHTELNFIPDPQEHELINFEVRWTNEWNFVWAFPVRTDRYKGTIELEGTEILASIPDWITIV